MSKSISRVHIYCRVSSTGQEDNTSFDTQETECRAWAEQRGYPVASVAREVFSSGELHRPELDAIIERLARGDVFLAYTKDRLSRHQKHPHILEYLIEQQGARLAFVMQESEETEEDILLGNVGNYTNSIERANFRRRTQEGRRKRVASGKPIAGPRPAYGYVWNADKSRYLIDPETSPVVRMIFDWTLDWVTLRGMSALLHEQGIPSPMGQERWSPAVLRALLLRHVYTGDAMAYAKRADRKPGGGYTRRSGTPDELVAVPNVAPPIVTREEMAAVAARLTMNKAHAARNNREPEGALLRAGFAVCGHCGWSLGVSNSPRSASGGEFALPL